MFQAHHKAAIIWFMFIFSCLFVQQVSAAHVEKEPIQLEVVLQREYVDGDISEEKIIETVWSLENFWVKYEQWELVKTTKTGLVFKKRVDDISPLLKANGYFGITRDGTLTIFNGKPHQTNIIQSFFQIDLDKLESRKHQQLQNGIPIKTKNRFVSVLETFKPYYIPLKIKQ